jgi:UPF0716 protein FxsA
MPLLLLLFLIVPLVELAVIIEVGQVIGAWWTIVLLVVDSLFGAWLVRREGRRAWQSFRMALEDARWPGREVAEGALVLIGGALLVTPGFVTDATGLLLVLPPTRRIVATFLEGRVVPMPIRAVGTRVFPGRSTRIDAEFDVMEVEVISVEREDLNDDQDLDDHGNPGDGDDVGPPAGPGVH